MYSGMTVSVKRQLSHGMYFQVGYTLAKAMDDGPDALVVGRPGNVQNSYATAAEWGPSVNDQRNRFVAACGGRAQVSLRNGALNLANNWKLSSVVTSGSGRPINATIAGRSQRRRQHLQRSPARVHPKCIHRPRLLQHRLASHAQHPLRRACRLEPDRRVLQVFNRTNARVQISDDGYYNSAGQFVAYSTTVKGKLYPGRIPDELAVS